MIRMLKYMSKRDFSYALYSLVFILVQVWLDLKLPDFMSRVTVLVKTPGSDILEILAAGAYMLLCAIGSFVATAIVGFFVARIAASLSKNLREAVYDKTMSFSLEEISRFSVASLITRSTGDINAIQMFVAMGLQIIVKSPILATWAIIKIAGKNLEWTLATGVALAIILIIVALIFVIVIPRFKIMQKLADRINLLARESLSGIRVIRAYNADKYHEARFEEAAETQKANGIFVNGAMAFMGPSMRLVLSLLTLAIYWIGLYIIQGSLQVDKLRVFSEMVVFSSYAMQVIMAFMMLTMIFVMYPRASVSANRINEILEVNLKIFDGKKALSTENVGKSDGKLEFRGLSFKYPDAEDYVLKDISLTVKPRETLAIIGSTGSGKSTLLNLIPRFFDASEGCVLVDDIDVRDYEQNALRAKLAYVSQKAQVFSGSVAYNVGYGSESKDEERIIDALKKAQAYDFVEKMQDNINSELARAGSNLSGGQKQRISIARAIYKDAKIMLFDDSFSALDYKTESLLRDALSKGKDCTKIIVAQRISTIVNSDQIAVLDEGKLVGLGKHEDLIKSCAIYREIAESQLSEEELKYA